MSFGSLAGARRSFMEEARGSVDKMLTELGLDPYIRECDCVSEVNFRRLKAMLDAIDDVDHLWLEEVAKEGVSLGVDEELPRVERVFEEKENWNLSFAEEEFRDVTAENYKSAENSSADVKRHMRWHLAPW